MFLNLGLFLPVLCEFPSIVWSPSMKFCFFAGKESHMFHVSSFVIYHRVLLFNWSQFIFFNIYHNLSPCIMHHGLNFYHHLSIFDHHCFHKIVIFDHKYYWSPLWLITITIDHHICHQIYHQHLQYDHDYLSSTCRVFHHKIPLFIIIYHHASRVMFCNFIIVEYHVSTFDHHYYHKIAIIDHHIFDHHWSLTILSHHIISLYIIDHHKNPLLSSFKKSSRL